MGSGTRSDMKYREVLGQWWRLTMTSKFRAKCKVLHPGLPRKVLFQLERMQKVGSTKRRRCRIWRPRLS